MLYQLRIPECYENPQNEGLRLESPWIVPEAAGFINKVLSDEFRIPKLSKNPIYGGLSLKIRVLDIGAGASTLFYARRVDTVHAYETQSDWADKVKETAYNHGLDYNIGIMYVNGEAGMLSELSRLNDKYQIISVDTVSPLNRDKFLLAALPHMAHCGLIVLDNYADDTMFPITHSFSQSELVTYLRPHLPGKALAVHEFNDIKWYGLGTRVVGVNYP